MAIEDRPNDFDVQLLVVVNGNIPEPDHGLHARRSLGIDQALRFQQPECLAAFLRQTEAMNAYEMHGEIDGCLAGTLKVQDNRILAQEVADKFGFVATIFVVEALYAALNDGAFVQYDIIGHRHCPVRGYHRESRAVLR